MRYPNARVERHGPRNYGMGWETEKSTQTHPALLDGLIWAGVLKNGITIHGLTSEHTYSVSSSAIISRNIGCFRPVFLESSL